MDNNVVYDDEVQSKRLLCQGWKLKCCFVTDWVAIQAESARRRSRSRRTTCPPGKNRQSQPRSMPHIMFETFVVPLINVAIQNVFVLVPPEAGQTRDVRRARHARGDPG